MNVLKNILGDKYSKNIGKTYGQKGNQCAFCTGHRSLRPIQEREWGLMTKGHFAKMKGTNAKVCRNCATLNKSEFEDE